MPYNHRAVPARWARGAFDPWRYQRRQPTRTAGEGKARNAV